MIKYKKENDEVLYPDESLVSVRSSDLEILDQLALKNPRERVRLCAHRNKDDILHEMFIVHTSNCYVRPHKHIGKVESMSILQGEAQVVMFDDDGNIERVIEVGDVQSGKTFYYRMSDPIFHTLLIQSPSLVFHEVTQGPFQREQTIFADWAPVDESPDVSDYLQNLTQKVSLFLEESSK